MKERWPWLAVLAAVLLTGFFLPDLSLAVQDRRAEGRTEIRAVDSPVLVHKEEEDIGFLLDDMEIVCDEPYGVSLDLSQGRELDFDTAVEACLPFLESMAVHNLIPDEMARGFDISASPVLLCTEDARTAVVWNIRLFHDEGAVIFLLDDKEGRLLAFTIKIYLPDNVAFASDESVLLDRLLRYCQESCAPLTCECAAWQDASIEGEELALRTAFHLSDGTGRTMDAEVFVNQVGNNYSVYSFNR